MGASWGLPSVTSSMGHSVKTVSIVWSIQEQSFDQVLPLIFFSLVP